MLQDNPQSELEYNGDQCVVLPANYLQTAQAAAELYADEIFSVVTDLRVEGLSQPRQPTVLARGVLAAALWLGSGALAACL